MEELEKFYKWLQREKIDLSWPFDIVYDDYKHRSFTRDEILELPLGTKVRLVNAPILNYIGDCYITIHNDNPFLNLKTFDLWSLDTGFYEFELMES